ncbi:MAG: hypothetical protein JNM36_00970 [Chitinophagales bacterium]|nr:hypothetical protein [Chitinophagales bacterium]
MKTIQLLLCIMLLSQTTMAQTADDVIAKYLQAIGGKENLQQIQVLRQTGIAKAWQDIPFNLTITRKGKSYQESTMQNKKIVRAFDGTTAWGNQPWTGRDINVKFDEDETKNIRFAADIDFAFVDYAQKGSSMRYIGEEDVDGALAYHLQLTTREGDTHDYFFDKDLYLLVKHKARIKRKDGSEQNYEEYYSAYKPVGKLLLPHDLESRTVEQGEEYNQFTKIKTYEINPTVEDSLFIMPAK